MKADSSVSLDFLRCQKFRIDKQLNRMKADSTVSLDFMRFPKFGIDKQQQSRMKADSASLWISEDFRNSELTSI